MEKQHILSPYGTPGTILWVRENWRPFEWSEQGFGKIEYAGGRVGDVEGPWGFSRMFPYGKDANRWRPSIHMPRWACRLTLKMTELTAVRIRDLTCSDFRSDGIRCPEHDFPGGFCVSECISLRRAFVKLWDGIYGKRYPYLSNPWVWKIGFIILEERK